MANESQPITGRNRQIIRDLACRVAEIAALPVQEERRRLWRRHNALRPDRPMILVFPEGAWRELLPASALNCTSEDARRIESNLRMRIYQHEHFDSDNVVEAIWGVGKAITNSGWGLDSKWRPSGEATGAGTYDPVVFEPADLKKLGFPEISHDLAASQRKLDEAADLLGDILKIEQKGVAHLSFHLMAQYTRLRGLAQVMTDMIENPQWVHDAMALIEEGNRRIVEQYEALNLLSLNNDNTYHSSGGVGYIDELPRPGGDPQRVRPADMWASAESQELAQVSPRMHAEFALAYEKRLLAPFGLTGYGCCENLTRKLDDVLTIPNIRRVSISPWADVDACAAKLGNHCIFSWKPHPAHLVGGFDHDQVRAYIRHTLEVTRDGVVEMILKDTHTCEYHPERFDDWTGIARQEVESL